MRQAGAALAAFVAVLASGGAAATEAAGREEGPVLYKLQKDATFQRGCFPPCLCPIMETAGVRGVFKLTFLGFDGLFDNYAVTEVSWLVERGGSDLRITGSGTYRIGGEFAVEQRMELDLQVDSDPVQRFDSGRVFGESRFPAIAITISINGGYCFDTVIDVRARPAMRLNVSDAQLWWDADPDATGYDLVRGDLGLLLGGGGDFSLAASECVADDVSGSSIPFTALPAPGEGFWFVAREVYGGGQGSYDSGDPDQLRSRDPGLAASPASCP